MLLKLCFCSASSACTCLVNAELLPVQWVTAPLGCYKSLHAKPVRLNNTRVKVLMATGANRASTTTVLLTLTCNHALPGPAFLLLAQLLLHVCCRATVLHAALRKASCYGAL